MIVIWMEAYIMKECTSFAKDTCLPDSLYTIATAWHAATMGPTQYSSDDYKNYVHRRYKVLSRMVQPE